MHIAFWSNVHGQTGTTNNLAAIALELALNYRFKILLMHNEYIKSSLDGVFLTESQINNDELIFDVGIDALMRFSKFNKLDENGFSNYTTALLKGKLDLLRGTSATSKEIFHRELDKVSENIFYNSKKFYDFIITDASAGNNYSEKILKESDLIVVNLNQNKKIIDSFLSSDIYKLYKEKCFYIIGFYNFDSRNSKKNMVRKYDFLSQGKLSSKLIGNSDKVGIVPYNIEFGDSCNEGEIIEFFLRNLNIESDKINYTFFNEIGKTVELILNKLDIDSDINKLGENDD